MAINGKSKYNLPFDFAVSRVYYIAVLIYARKPYNYAKAIYLYNSHIFALIVLYFRYGFIFSAIAYILYLHLIGILYSNIKIMSVYYICMLVKYYYMVYGVLNI